MQTQLVIFDCDGVLVDSETLGNRILVEFVAEFGLVLELQEAILLFKGCKIADCVAVIEQRLGKNSMPCSKKYCPSSKPIKHLIAS